MASVQPDEATQSTPMEGVSSSIQYHQSEKAPSETDTNTVASVVQAAPAASRDAAQPPLSKNALKRMRKQQEWEDGKDARRKLRKEKRQASRIRKREEKAALVAQGIDPYALTPRKPPPINVPVSIIFDCDFEQYMVNKELISLGSQITRSYSENRTTRYRTQLWVSNWNGKLAERFREVLEDKHKNWKGIEFLEGDFIECAKQARQKMKTDGGKISEALQRSLDDKVPWVRDEKDPLPLPDPEPEPREEYKDIVYLSSDSPYTLDRLEPNTSYVIGGLVDKNREKGICYKRARELGIRTARLPIGQYMVMQSRQVLATNHVVEIMLKWLEYENWGDAFLSVIPKRKGGQLRKQGTEEQDDDDDDDDEEVEEVEEVEEKAEGKNGVANSDDTEGASGETAPNPL